MATGSPDVVEEHSTSSSDLRSSDNARSPLVRILSPEAIVTLGSADTDDVKPLIVQPASLPSLNVSLPSVDPPISLGNLQKASSKTSNLVKRSSSELKTPVLVVGLATSSSLLHSSQSEGGLPLALGETKRGIPDRLTTEWSMLPSSILPTHDTSGTSSVSLTSNISTEAVTQCNHTPSRNSAGKLNVLNLANHMLLASPLLSDVITAPPEGTTEEAALCGAPASFAPTAVIPPPPVRLTSVPVPKDVSFQHESADDGGGCEMGASISPASHGRLRGPFVPLIQQLDYRKSDIKRIAETSVYTCTDLVSSMEVSLQTKRTAALGKLDPVERVMREMIQSGVPKTLELAQVIPHVTIHDFTSAAVGYDSIILALSLALWGSVLYARDIVAAARRYFNAVLTEEEKQNHRTRLRVTLSVFLSWLNEEGIDVLIMTSDREACSSYCAKHAAADDLQRRSRYCRIGLNPRESLVDLPMVSTLNADTLQLSDAVSTAISLPAANSSETRVLAALEYDVKRKLWGPVTTARRIRAAEHAAYRGRRHQRKLQRQSRRRTARRAARQAAAEEAARNIAAKLAEWEEYKQRIETEVIVDHGTVILPPNHVEEFLFKEVLSKPSTDGLPFEHMEYPTIIQTDFAVGTLLREATHPVLSNTRWKLFLGSILAILSACCAVALIVYVQRSYSVCAFSRSLNRCVATAADGSLDNCLQYVTVGFSSSPIIRYLFGMPLSVGNVLVVVVSLEMVATCFGVLLIVFATRFMATGSRRPGYLYLIQGCHALLSVVALGFAAFALSHLSRRSSILSCRAFKNIDRALCTNKLESCPDFYYQVSPGTAVPGLPLALGIVLLVLCALELAVALVPALPSRSVRRELPTATPQTQAFRPSRFAPDGISSEQVAELQRTIHPRLREQLQRHIEMQEQLLKRSLTVGEMMQAHREFSLRQMNRTNQKKREHLRKRREYRATRRIVHYVRDTATAADTADPIEAIGDNFVLGPHLSAAVRNVSRALKRRLETCEMLEAIPVASLTTSVHAFQNNRAVDETAPASQRLSSNDLGSISKPLPKTKSSQQLNAIPRSLSAIGSTMAASGSSARSSREPRRTARAVSNINLRVNSVDSEQRSGSSRSPLPILRAKDKLLQEKAANIESIVQRLREGSQNQ